MLKIIKGEETVKIVYFDDESALNQNIVFEGTVEDLRKSNADWNGYEIREKFSLENKEVQVYSRIINLDDVSLEYNYYYFIGPSWLDASKINHDKLVV